MPVERNILRDSRNRPIPLYGANAGTFFSLNSSTGDTKSVFSRCGRGI
jgi:hypothetical protein